MLRDGKLGIGTSNPSAELDVVGTTELNGDVDIAGDVHINDNDLFLRAGTDQNHGLGWFGSGKTFENTDVGGPVLYGHAGGALGSTSGGEKIALSWDNNRNVTIPDDLTVGNDLRVADDVIVQDRVEIDRSSTHDHGRVKIINRFGARSVVMGVTNAGHSYVGVIDSNSSIVASFRVEGNVGIMQADVKNFAVPNPNDPATDIVYACVEGPEAAMYVRGTGHLVNGRATIELPDHFIALAVEEGMTVQLTPRSFDSLGLATAAQRLSGIEVGELHRGRGNYAFDWEVKAVRRAHQDYQVLRSWTERMDGSDLTEEELWEGRLRSVEQREQRIADMEARLEAQRAGNSGSN